MPAHQRLIDSDWRSDSLGFVLENCQGGGHWRNLDLDFKGGGGGGGDMVVKDVTKFHKHYLGGWGIFVCICVCRISYRILSFGKGGTPKVVLRWRGYIAKMDC